MRFFSNDNADDRVADLPDFALGYVVLVEVVSLRRRTGSSAAGGGRDERQRPLRRARARATRAGTGSTPSSRSWSCVGAARVRWCWRLYERGQFEYDMWEPFVTPDYVEALLVDGLLKTLQMACARDPLRRRASALVLRRRQALRPRLAALAVLGWSSSSSAPCRCCC